LRRLSRPDCEPNDLERTAMHEMKTLGTSELVLSHEYKAGFAYWAGFLKDVIERELPHERFVHWDTTASSLDELLVYATHSSKLSWGSAALLDLEEEAGCFAAMSVSSGGVSVHLAAETTAALAVGEA